MGKFCTMRVAWAAQFPCAGRTGVKIPGMKERRVWPIMPLLAVCSITAKRLRREWGRSRLGAVLSGEDAGRATVRLSRGSAMQLWSNSCNRNHLPACWAGQAGGAQEGFPRWEGWEGGRVSHEREGAESGGGLPAITIAAGLGLPCGGEWGGRKEGSSPLWREFRKDQDREMKVLRDKKQSLQKQCLARLWWYFLPPSRQRASRQSTLTDRREKLNSTSNKQLCSEAPLGLHGSGVWL